MPETRPCNVDAAFSGAFQEMAPQQSRPSPSISQTTRCVGGKRVTHGAAHEGWRLDLGLGFVGSRVQ